MCMIHMLSTRVDIHKAKKEISETSLSKPLRPDNVISLEVFNISTIVSENHLVCLEMFTRMIAN